MGACLRWEDGHDTAGVRIVQPEFEHGGEPWRRGMAHTMRRRADLPPSQYLESLPSQKYEVVRRCECFHLYPCVAGQVQCLEARDGGTERQRQKPGSVCVRIFDTAASALG